MGDAEARCLLKQMALRGEEVVCVPTQQAVGGVIYEVVRACNRTRGDFVRMILDTKFGGMKNVEDIQTDCVLLTRPVLDTMYMMLVEATHFAGNERDSNCAAVLGRDMLRWPEALGILQAGDEARFVQYCVANSEVVLDVVAVYDALEMLGRPVEPEAPLLTCAEAACTSPSALLHTVDACRRLNPSLKFELAPASPAVRELYTAIRRIRTDVSCTAERVDNRQLCSIMIPARKPPCASLWSYTDQVHKSRAGVRVIDGEWTNSDTLSVLKQSADVLQISGTSARVVQLTTRGITTVRVYAVDICQNCGCIHTHGQDRTAVKMCACCKSAKVWVRQYPHTWT